MIELLKNNPGKYSYGSAGDAGSVAGQINTMFDNVPGTLAQSCASKVHSIAPTSATLTTVAPEIPAIADTRAYRDSEEARLAPIIRASGARID
ncbi:MAG: hypothetical protein ACHQK9_14525 [Reyranellales bacterium]